MSDEGMRSCAPRPSTHARDDLTYAMFSSTDLYVPATSFPFQLSRSQKEVVALGVSLANNCPHCAYIHTAMGAAAGSDVQFGNLHRFYQTRDADIGFPLTDGADPLVHNLASWAIKHRDGAGRERSIPCAVSEPRSLLLPLSLDRLSCQAGMP